jgi:succinylglutamate desuccinylase
MNPQNTLEQLSKIGMDYGHPSGAAHTWQIKGENPGPAVTILGGTHGNETIGVEVVEELLKKALNEGVKGGSLNLGVANPQAYLHNTRGFHGDLNRCFGENPNPFDDSYPWQRAKSLKPMLQQSDVLFDLHATIKPSDPFLVVADVNHQLAHCLSFLGLQTVLTGKGLLSPSGEAICTDNFVAKHGGLGVTIESGWLEDPETAKVQQGLLSALHQLGIFHCPDQVAEETKLEIFDCYQCVPAGHEFQFLQEWKNFEAIAAGQALATQGGITLAPSEDSLVVFPKGGVLDPGTIACLLAKKLAA